jgi:ribosomal protein L19E
MPEITVSEDLYRQLRTAAADEDIDRTMWRMVYSYQRGNSPGD